MWSIPIDLSHRYEVDRDGKLMCKYGGEQGPEDDCLVMVVYYNSDMAVKKHHNKHRFKKYIMFSILALSFVGISSVATLAVVSLTTREEKIKDDSRSTNGPTEIKLELTNEQCEKLRQDNLRVAEEKAEELHKFEDEVIKLQNDYRSLHGLPPLVKNERLMKSANAKAKDMVKNNYWSHNDADGNTPWFWFNQVQYTYDRAGENLAHGQKSAGEVVGGWINSPGHEKNLVGEYTETGVSVILADAYQGSVNEYVIVSHYGRPR